jgi:hypothetical protein
VQSLALDETGTPLSMAPPLPATPRRRLPDLAPLTALTALNLADNCLTRVPAALAALPRMRFVDLSNNPNLQVRPRGWDLLFQGSLMLSTRCSN